MGKINVGVAVGIGVLLAVGLNIRVEVDNKVAGTEVAAVSRVGDVCTAAG